MMKSVRVVWGSQTGASEEIARQIYERCKHKNIQNCELTSMLEYEKIDFQSDIIIFVVSSTGDGDPPDNALKFMRHLRTLRRNLDSTSSAALPFQNLSFTLLGLGDTNYPTFQGNPTNLYNTIVQLGGVEFYKRGVVDEVLGLEEQVEEWISGLWSALDTFLHPPPFTPPTANEIPPETNSAHINHNNDDNNINDNSTSPLTTTTMGNAASNNNNNNENNGSGGAKKKFVFKKKEKSAAGGGGGGGEVKSGNIKPAALPTNRLEVNVIRIGDNNNDSDNGDDDGETFVMKYAEAMNSNHHPFRGTITNATWLTHQNAIKQTLQLDVDISAHPVSAYPPPPSASSPSLPYLPGDSFAIFAPNPTGLVNEIIERLGYQVGDRVEIKERSDGEVGRSEVWHKLGNRCKLTHLLQWCCDLNSLPRKGFLRMLAEYTSDADHRSHLLYLSSITGKELFKREIEEKMPNLYQLLMKYPTCIPPLDHLLSTLPPLQPRYYSVLSSPLMSPKHIQIAYTLVDYYPPSSSPSSLSSTEDNNNDNGNDKYDHKRGLATTYLSGIALSHFDHLQCRAPLRENDKFDDDNDDHIRSIIMFRNQSNESFHLPDDRSIPIVMIGPGTGVVPFIGFLRHRRSQRREEEDNALQIGESWLFFGCRNAELDYIYQSELEGFIDDRTLTHLIVAFSRDTSSSSIVGSSNAVVGGSGGDNNNNNNGDVTQRVYVQHKLLEYCDQMADLLLHRNAIFYICGDAKGMAKGVQNALKEILIKGGMTENEATLQLSTFMKQKRIIFDVWA